MLKRFLAIILITMTGITSSAQDLGSFEIDLSSESGEIDVLATIDISKFNIAEGTSIQLVYPSNSKKRQVKPSQTDWSNRKLTFIIPKSAVQKEKKQVYRLVKNPQKSPAWPNVMSTRDKDGSLIISNTESGIKDLLNYAFKTVYPPAGIDTNYKRSGFIHPLRTPHGQELTRIQPPDHYHHYGIWNPWTHTLFENDTIDFWNIKGRKGTVRFVKFTSIPVDGPLYAEYEVLHEHVVFKKDGSEKVALNEVQTVRVHKPSKENDYYIVDFTSEMSCASASPLLIVAYRYGGFGWRATEYWHKDNSEMLTSEGKTRDNTDGTKARWCMVYGELPGNDTGGIVMLSHPQNYNHPEPLRIWDKKANNGRGDVFANFAPTKDKDWLLEPGKKYVLKYRLVVFNGKFDAAKAESAWQQFAKPLNVKIQ